MSTEKAFQQQSTNYINSNVEALNLRQKLEVLIAQQSSRVLNSGASTPDLMQSAFQNLKLNHLLPADIERDVCNELYEVCSQKLDVINTYSNRQLGFGWSTNHIKDHMRRFLKEKISKVYEIMKQACKK